MFTGTIRKRYIVGGLGLTFNRTVLSTFPILAFTELGLHLRGNHARTCWNQGRKAHKPNDQRRAPASSLPMTGTPLHWSAYRGDLGITWILLKVGACPSGNTFKKPLRNSNGLSSRSIVVAGGASCASLQNALARSGQGRASG